MTDVRSRRLIFVALLAALVAVASLTAAPTAGAKAKTCADQVVADWYGDGRVDKLFPKECYLEAIRSLPVDVLDYSNAKEDILRALQYRRQGKPDPGPAGSPSETTPEDPSGNPGDPGDPGDPGGEGTTATGDPVDTSGPSSLPIPLLILGGLALLLLAAGGVGYLSRRAPARRKGGPPSPG